MLVVVIKFLPGNSVQFIHSLFNFQAALQNTPDTHQHSTRKLLLYNSTAHLTDFANSPNSMASVGLLQPNQGPL